MGVQALLQLGAGVMVCHAGPEASAAGYRDALAGRSATSLAAERSITSELALRLRCAPGLRVVGAASTSSGGSPSPAPTPRPPAAPRLSASASRAAAAPGPPSASASSSALAARVAASSLRRDLRLRHQGDGGDLVALRHALDGRTPWSCARCGGSAPRPCA